MITDLFTADDLLTMLRSVFHRSRFDADAETTTAIGLAIAGLVLRSDRPYEKADLGVLDDWLRHGGIAAAGLVEAKDFQTAAWWGGRDNIAKAITRAHAWRAEADEKSAMLRAVREQAGL